MAARSSKTEVVPGEAGRPEEPLKNRWYNLFYCEDYNVPPGRVSGGFVRRNPNLPTINKTYVMKKINYFCIFWEKEKQGNNNLLNHKKTGAVISPPMTSKK